MTTILIVDDEYLVADILSFALEDEGYLAALRPRFGTFLGEIALAGTRFAYPLRLTLANAMVGPRLALVGDAAHGLHPIAGQG